MALAGGGSRRRKRVARARSKLTSIADIKRRAAKCGSHFFDKDTMRFFRSRISQGVYKTPDAKCAYFVTSEEGPSGGRRYTVRKQCGCRIDTAGKFQAYTSLNGAKAAAKRLAAKGK